jgi:hypothetical protein
MKYRIDVDGTHPVYTAPPKSREELDLRTAEISSRPNGGRNLGDFADLAKTSTKERSASWDRQRREHGTDCILEHSLRRHLGGGSW